MEVDYIFLNLLLISTLFIFNKPISNIVKISDFPEKRKSQKKPIPLIGGFIIYLIVLFNFLYFKNVNEKIFYLSSIFFIIGLLDDKFKLSPNIRLIILTICSIIFLYKFPYFNINFLHFENFGKIYFYSQTTVIFTVLCLLLFQNSMNMIDGINGLSGSIFLILFFFILIKSGFEPIYLTIIFCLLIFLIFNFKNKFFMGDSGIYFLSIFFGLNIITISNDNIIYTEEIFLIMMIPGIDMLRLFIIRIKNKKNPFKPDRLHIHHLIENKTKSKLKTLFIIISIIYIPILLMTFVNINTNYLILFSIFLYSVVIYKIGGLSFIKK